MASGGKGVFWKDEEVHALLNLVLRSRKAGVLMKSTHLPNRQHFSRIAVRMREAGFVRSTEQCRSKFKRVKGAFYDALESWQGIPRQSGKPPFFNDMMRLWEAAGKPSWRDRYHGAAIRRRDEQASHPGETEEEARGDLEQSSEEESPPVSTVPEQEPPNPDLVEEQPCSSTACQPGPSTPAVPGPATGARGRTIDDLFALVESMDVRTTASLNSIQRRMSTYEGRMMRFGRRMDSMERRQREMEESQSSARHAEGPANP
ncbi:uncharacterized protein LOC129335122 [Eublepharis macularius]|uniref:Uncharacterized protein LOC129335122 n=1 Tax=Eublepharis macularius TaxID=481883 RepID=A0AA97JQV9_EUBMA|nr:uncharacterized protein LOC129335122 [Eublepharis macularius]